MSILSVYLLRILLIIRKRMCRGAASILLMTEIVEWVLERIRRRQEHTRKTNIPLNDAKKASCADRMG